MTPQYRGTYADTTLQANFASWHGDGVDGNGNGNGAPTAAEKPHPVNT